GLRLLPLTATLFVVAPLAGALVNRIGEQVLVAGGLLLQAIGIAWVGLVAAPSLPYAELIAPLIIAGCGASFSIPATQNAVINAVKEHEIGKASGAFSMFRQLGGAFGVATLAAVFAAAGGLGSAQAFSSGFSHALIVAAALALVGAIAGMALPGRQAKEVEPEAPQTDTPCEEALSV
ncbi:MAG TPA: MFS transporter, partial [Ktedonobacterales bacterium]|nr:MFS transporter [Ktedonobacterales bacterium]